MNFRNRKNTFAVTLLPLIAVLAVLDLGTGAAGFGAVFHGGDTGREILTGIRLPRVVTAILAGAILGLSGALMQAVFRNPLADPHIMGVSAGAGTGAALTTLFIAGHSAPTITSGAFAGALLASFLILSASSKVRSGNTLLIFGVMTGFVFSAITSVAAYSSSQESLKIFYNWSAGSFSGTGWEQICTMAVVLAVGMALSLLIVRELNLILFGDEYASLAGASPSRTRFAALFCCSLMTASATAFCGPVGFVGIAAPHIVRRGLGTSAHRHVIPWSPVAGAAMTLLADKASQSFTISMPAGSIIALIGIPAVLVILFRHR